MLDADELLDRLVEGGLAQESDIQGCSEEEIREIEISNGVQLPSSYKEFLIVAGRGAGEELFDGMSAFYPEILTSTKEIRRIFGKFNEFPDHMFVVNDHNGDNAAYFVADGKSDDPPIFVWSCDDESSTYAYPSFWAMVEEELEECERRKRLKDSRH